MRLTEHIALVGSSRFGLSNPFDCSVYAVDCGESVVLIDAGCGMEPELIEANLRQDGFDPTRISAILLTHTHSDHAGGCRWWKDRTGCQILAPEGERGVVEGTEDVSGVIEVAKQAGIYPPHYTFQTTEVDAGVRDGDVLALGDCHFHAIEVAGHSRHHTCYRADIDGRRVLFSGDAVLHGGSLHLQNIPECSLADYRRDIGKLAGLEIDTLLPGHGIFVMRYGQEHLNRAIEALGKLAMPPNFPSLCPKVIPTLYRTERH